MRRTPPAILAAALALAAPAHAQPETQPEPGPSEPLSTSGEREYGFFSGSYEPADPLPDRFEFEPFVWYASPGGEVSFGEGSTLTHTSDLSIDDPRLSGGAELHLVRDKWRFSLLGAHVSQNGGAVQNAPSQQGPISVMTGDTLRTEFDLTTVSLRGGYRLWEFEVDPTDAGVPEISSSVDLVAGLRAFDYQLETEVIAGSPPARTSGDMFHVEPVVGAKWEIHFRDRYTIDFSSNVGFLPEISDQSSSSLDLTVGFKWRPHRNVAAQIGYRLLVFDLESDDVEAEGALAGLYTGVVLRF